jgi:hypothetical protein
MATSVSAKIWHYDQYRTNERGRPLSSQEIATIEQYLEWAEATKEAADLIETVRPKAKQ